MDKFKIKKTNLLTFVLIILLLLFLNNNIAYCMESNNSTSSTLIKDIEYLNGLQPDFINTSIRQHLRLLENGPLYNQAIEYYKECIFIKKENPFLIKSELHKIMLDNKKEIILEKIRYVPPSLYYDVHKSILHLDLLADCIKNYFADI